MASHFSKHGVRASAGRRSRSAVRFAAAVTAALALAACDPSDKLLNAPDPDIIDPGNLNSPEGAEALRAGTIGRLRNMTAGSIFGGESMWLLGGLLTDEY